MVSRAALFAPYVISEFMVLIYSLSKLLFREKGRHALSHAASTTTLELLIHDLTGKIPITAIQSSTGR